MGGGLWGFAMAAEQPLESLLLRVLGRARLDVPHAERNVPARRHDDLVFVISVVGFRVVQAHVLHDAVDKARREGCGFGAMDDPLVVAGKPYRDVGRGGAHFHLELGATVAATLRPRISNERPTYQKRRTTLSFMGCDSLPTNMLMRCSMGWFRAR